MARAPTPRCGGYPLDQVMALRERLREALVCEFPTPGPPPDFERLSAVVYDLLPCYPRPPALEDSLAVFAGTPMTRPLVDRVCWRLAGNLPLLRRHIAVLPWRTQRQREWVPLAVEACRRQTRRRAGPGAEYRFRVLAGTPCAEASTRWWSAAQIRYVARDFGFDRPRGSRPAVRPYAAPEQLVGLRLYGLVEPELSAARPGFQKVRWLPAVRAHNREVLRGRFRLASGYPCPLRLPATFECHRCPAGFAQCAAACHKAPWVTAPCSHCRREEAFFDPGDPGAPCVDCARKEAGQHG